MFNSELIVIDPANLVPMALLTRQRQQWEGGMKGFPQLKGLFPVPVTAYLPLFVEKMDTKENHKKNSRSDCGGLEKHT